MVEHGEGEQDCVASPVMDASPVSSASAIVRLPARIIAHVAREMDRVLRPVAVGGRGDAMTHVQPGSAFALELPGDVDVQSLRTFGHHEHAEAVHEHRRLGGQHLGRPRTMPAKP